MLPKTWTTFSGQFESVLVVNLIGVCIAKFLFKKIISASDKTHKLLEVAPQSRITFEEYVACGLRQTYKSIYRHFRKKKIAKATLEAFRRNSISDNHTNISDMLAYIKFRIEFESLNRPIDINIKPINPKQIVSNHFHVEYSDELFELFNSRIAAAIKFKTNFDYHNSSTWSTIYQLINKIFGLFVEEYLGLFATYFKNFISTNKIDENFIYGSLANTTIETRKFAIMLEIVPNQSANDNQFILIYQIKPS